MLLWENVLVVFSSMEANLRNILERAGLSEKESTCYLRLLRHGTRPTSFIAKKAELNRGTAYVVLHALVEKGLAVKSSSNNRQTFTAVEPDALLQYVEGKERDLRRAKSEIAEHLDSFEGLVNTHTSKPRIAYYEGTEGARIAYQDMFTSKDPILRGFLSIADMAEVIGEETFQDFTRIRIESGYHLHLLRTREQDLAAYKKLRYAKNYRSRKEDARVVKYVSDDLAFPVSMFLYDDKILVITSKEENAAFIIQSRELATMQKKLFALIWETASTSPEE